MSDEPRNASAPTSWALAEQGRATSAWTRASTAPTTRRVDRLVARRAPARFSPLTLGIRRGAAAAPAARRLRYIRRSRSTRSSRAAGARPERRRRLGRPARPRLHRLLRLRRVPVRLALVGAARPSTGRRSALRSSWSSCGAARPAARPAVTAPGGRLPRDRDALLRAALRHADAQPRPHRLRPGATSRLNLTGGPNGIAGVDSLRFLGLRARGLSTRLLLRARWSLAVIADRSSASVPIVNDSRTGRAWRAVREDPLAAELMTIPVYRLQAPGLRDRRRDRRPDGRRSSPVADAVFPDELRRDAADHDLRGGHPRAARQPRRRRPGRGRRRRAARDPARRPTTPRWLFYGTVLARARGEAAAVADAAAVVLGGTVVFGFAVHGAGRPGLARAARRGRPRRRRLGELARRTGWCSRPRAGTRSATSPSCVMVAAVLCSTLCDG